ncbi:hypothetical protein [Hyphomicrobium sulfonivorans]|uniref:hypothetical protein n=1 Tax=Hyphomicrobium sulfonivorans TaxID=121290 RepID=UPI0015708EA0|nr:hypothetical protein [Hyphomicrobium sulfonivorans]MBI1649889.1 hypothetical protein [Hyphomicrobium sulfonivorans]NSL71800.1 hypothetical protein [Hyphomicrobium sulfonivorans]
MATDNAAVSAVIEIARKLIKQAVALVDSAAHVGRQISADRAAIDRMVSTLGVTHRWVGTRLDILGPQGEWITGPDLKGFKGDKGASLVNRGQWADGATYGQNEYVFATASSGIGSSMWISLRQEQFVSTVHPRDDAYRWIEFVAPQGEKGDKGNNAWTAVYAFDTNGERRALKIIDWFGGTGEKPPAGQYLGIGGLVDNIEDAENVRPPVGDGTGDMLAAIYDPNGDGKVAAADAADTVPVAGVDGLQSVLDGKADTERIGAVNGIASLDASGKVPAAQLPSYVDDVLEFSSLEAFPAVGEGGKIYTATDTNKIYRWSGSVYIEIASSPGTTDVIAEGVSNLYFTAARVRAVTLTGLTTASSAAVAAADTLLAAIGKLQAQIAQKAGTNVASTAVAGLMSTTDKAKLDGIAAGANVTDAASVAASISGSDAKANPADADTFGLVDSAASNGLSRLSWAGIKAALKTHFDTIYLQSSRVVDSGAGLTGGGALDADRTIAIDKASAANLRAGASNKVVTSDTALAASAWVELPYAASIAISHDHGVNRSLLLTGNAVIAAPTEPKPGWPLVIAVKQDATGGRSIAWNAAYSFGPEGAPFLSTAPNAEDLVSFVCREAGRYVFLGIKKGI